MQQSELIWTKLLRFKKPLLFDRHYDHIKPLHTCVKHKKCFFLNLSILMTSLRSFTSIFWLLSWIFDHKILYTQFRPRSLVNAQKFDASLKSSSAEQKTGGSEILSGGGSKGALPTPPVTKFFSISCSILAPPPGKILDLPLLRNCPFCLFSTRLSFWHTVVWTHLQTTWIYSVHVIIKIETVVILKWRHTFSM